MRAFKLASRMLLIGLGMLAITLFTQPILADTIDFSCGAGTCTGTVVQTGTDYSSTGIGLSSNLENDPFTLIFDTSQIGNLGSIQIQENGVTDFVGTITSFTASSSGSLTDLNLAANWNVLPADANNPSGETPFSTVITLSVGDPTLDAYSVDVPMITPEPAVPVLLTGSLLALGFLLKRKAAVLA